MREYAAPLLVLLLAASCAAQEQYATLQGYVKDSKTGRSLADVRVDVYRSDDHGNVLTSAKTDERGFYSMQAPPGAYYDVYLRMGDVNPNQRTGEPAAARGVYTLNFNIASESNYQQSIVEGYGPQLAAAAGALILLAIVADQILSRRRRPREPGAEDLKRQRQQIEEMMALAKGKFHRREIDEESYREITRNQQERLLELETRLKGLEGKR
jgi:hypothetical protein